MTIRRALMCATLIATAVTGTAVPAAARPTVRACVVDEFGFRAVYVCGTKVLRPDWDDDGQHDETFFIAQDTRIMRVAPRVAPRNVSDGKAKNLVRSELRDSGARRVYVQTARRLYYSQDSDGSGRWGPWIHYRP